MPKPFSKDARKKGALARGEYPVVPFRIHPDDLELIERAAFKERKKRAHFIEQAAVDRAAVVLGIESPKAA